LELGLVISRREKASGENFVLKHPSRLEEDKQHIVKSLKESESIFTFIQKIKFRKFLWTEIR
jgi:hypothetical protein